MPTGVGAFHLTNYMQSCIIIVLLLDKGVLRRYAEGYVRYVQGQTVTIEQQLAHYEHHFFPPDCLAQSRIFRESEL